MQSYPLCHIYVIPSPDAGHRLCSMLPVTNRILFDKYIFRDGEDGLLVENGKTEELAEKINYLIENKQIRKEMGKKARINVQRFAEDVIMQQWIQLFNNLLNGTEQ